MDFLTHGKERKMAAHQEKERFAEEMLAGLKAAPALLDMPTCEALEKALEGHGYTRRLALAVLTRSGADILSEIERNRDFAVAMADCLLRLRSYSPLLREARRLARTAEARLTVALAMREDMREILAEARGRERKAHRGAMRA
jgi:hypothetical protein